LTRTVSANNGSRWGSAAGSSRMETRVVVPDGRLAGVVSKGEMPNAVAAGTLI
jgi:hypothetical protein